MNKSIAPSILVVHELDQRLRVRCQFIKESGIEPHYVEACLELIPGVQQARVNTKAASIVIHYDGLQKSKKDIFTALVSIPNRTQTGRCGSKILNSVLSLGLQGLLALAIPFASPFVAASIAAVLSFPVISKGLITLLTKGIKVELLDASAVSFCLIRGNYFTASSIAFLLSTGQYLEQLTENKTTGLLKSLLKPQVENIWIEEQGQEIAIPLAQARIGDRVICGPGELVPLDGTVLSGEASINTSSITGESIPRHIQPGMEVMSGSVIEDGRIVFSATRVGSETSMARIATFLENSLRNHSESQKQSEKLADKLVPITFGLGLGLLALTRNLEKAAAVLTIDYSCAIKLTNPVAARMAMFTAAGHGVLLKGAQAMDALARIDTLIFDKTGTLTLGQLHVTDVHGLLFSDDELLRLAAGAEAHYSHPVATSVVQAAKARGLQLPRTSQVDFIVAHGVSAYIQQRNILVGSRHFIEEDEGISCHEVNKLAVDLQLQGKSLLYVACDGKLAGIVALRDEVRPEAETVLRELKESGIGQIIVLTGDAELTAKSLVEQLPDIDAVHWELKPEDKAAIVLDLQSQGHRLGFIGDGVNDAPALVSADVGICLPGGADLARESAQVLLIRDDLEALLMARKIALHSQSTIKRCFISTVLLNSSFLLMASFGWLRPVGSALLHNISTLATLGYAVGRAKRIPRLTSGQNDSGAGG